MKLNVVYRPIFEQQVSLGKFEGLPTDEFQAINFFIDNQHVGRMTFGFHKRIKGFKHNEPIFDCYGTIDDVYIHGRTNSMRMIYPEVEKRLKKAGATRIKLNTTSDEVGSKVWRPLGFELVGSIGAGGTKLWEKTV